MKTANRGFTLLIAVIFMSVMLALGLALGSLAYKQSILASAALQSQFAFFAADSALECALYADQQLTLFAYANNSTPGSLSCGDTQTALATVCFNTGSCPLQWVSTARISLDGGSRCADVTAYKTQSQTAGSTYIFSQGYNVSCATVNSPTGARLVARGLEAHY